MPYHSWHHAGAVNRVRAISSPANSARAPARARPMWVDLQRILLVRIPLERRILGRG